MSHDNLLNHGFLLHHNDSFLFFAIGGRFRSLRSLWLRMLDEGSFRFLVIQFFRHI